MTQRRQDKKLKRFGFTRPTSEDGVSLRGPPFKFRRRFMVLRCKIGVNLVLNFPLCQNKQSLIHITSVSLVPFDGGVIDFSEEDLPAPDSHSVPPWYRRLQFLCK